VGRKVEVPITPSVLEWAIKESGYSLPEVSSGIEGGEQTLAAWLNETAKPSLTELKRVASKLHRQLATFLLPAPPATTGVSVKFRHHLGDHDRPLNAVELRYLRRARRIQNAHVWLLRELDRPEPSLPVRTLSVDPAKVAAEIRARLGLTVAMQIEWRSPSVAFDAWRDAVEQLGVTVLLFPMGERSCRGFSLWDDLAPIIAVNTAWKDEARIFTLFHELGHLVTRTSSACDLSETSTGHAQEPAERWCESFAADVVVPVSAVHDVSLVTDLKTLSRLATRYKVSLRAMAIRLIGIGKADWSLYRAIPSAADRKREGGAGGTGRNRREIREDEFGRRGTDVFVEAVRREVITESQALDYLDIPVADFARLAHAAPVEP
jgi:Zn-dependent peptidase ImmA (M78 family)